MNLQSMESSLVELKKVNKTMLEKIKKLSESTCLCACHDQTREDEFHRRLESVESKTDEHTSQLRSLQDSDEKARKDIEKWKNRTRNLEQELQEIKQLMRSKQTNEKDDSLPGETDRHRVRDIENVVEKNDGNKVTQTHKTADGVTQTHKTADGATQTHKTADVQVRLDDNPAKDRSNIHIFRQRAEAGTSVATPQVVELRTECDEEEVGNESNQNVVTIDNAEDELKQLVPVSQSASGKSDERNPDRHVVRREQLDAVHPGNDPQARKHECIHQTEKKICLDYSWDIQCNSEKRQVSAIEGHFNDDTVDTVLCIDTSESMVENGAWEQTCVFVQDYLTGIEEMASTKHITHERVALVTFGRHNRVCQHLTNDMQAVRTAFDNLTLGGPSPLYGGLILCNAAMNIDSFDANGIEVYTKIILITDGKPTETCLVSGPDVCEPKNEEGSKSRILQIAENMSSLELDLFCVPVGEEKNDFLELFVEMSEGIMVNHKAGRTLARRLSLTMEVSQEQKTGLLGLLSFMPSVYWDEEHNMYCQRMESFADRIEKQKILTRTQHKDRQKSKRIHDEIYRDTNDPSLPRVGTRVRRGPDGNPAIMRDEDGPGTITGHHVEPGHVVVRWDTDKIEKCRYGNLDQYDVIIVDEPRVVPEDTRMAVGCTVCPGREWTTNENFPDRNVTGVVIGYNESDGMVKVKWENGINNVLSYSELNEEVVLLQNRRRQRAIEPPLGTSGTPPGSSRPPPGSSRHPPGTSGTPPGSSRPPPGSSRRPPGTSGTPPGSSRPQPGTLGPPPASSNRQKNKNIMPGSLKKK